MTIIAIIPAVVCVLGALIWALGSTKIKTLGIIMFAAGLLVWLFTVAQHVWKF